MREREKEREREREREKKRKSEHTGRLTPVLSLINHITGKQRVPGEGGRACVCMSVCVCVCVCVCT